MENERLSIVAGQEAELWTARPLGENHPEITLHRLEVLEMLNRDAPVEADVASLRKALDQVPEGTPCLVAIGTDSTRYRLTAGALLEAMNDALANPVRRVITSKALNVRGAPGTASKILLTLKAGAPLVVEDKATSADDYEWVKVLESQAGGVGGFVATKFLVGE